MVPSEEMKVVSHPYPYPFSVSSLDSWDGPPKKRPGKVCPRGLPVPRFGLFNSHSPSQLPKNLVPGHAPTQPSHCNSHSSHFKKSTSHRRRRWRTFLLATPVLEAFHVKVHVAIAAAIAAATATVPFASASDPYWPR